MKLLKYNGMKSLKYNGIYSNTFDHFFQAADMSLSFDEQILEAAKSIAAATAALVKSASAAQRELVAQGKVRNLPCFTSYPATFLHWT